ncbi:MAG: HAMP domain-containing protein [Anaerolineales bacterium]|nr:HAMP domain-containing protein [Anaerolineales bacterium]
MIKQISGNRTNRRWFRSLQAQLTAAYTFVSLITMMILVFGGSYALTIYYTVSGTQGQQLQEKLQNAMSYVTAKQDGSTLDSNNLVNSVAASCELQLRSGSTNGVTTIGRGLDRFEPCASNRSFRLGLQQGPERYQSYDNLKSLTIWQPTGEQIIIDRDGVHYDAGMLTEAQRAVINNGRHNPTHAVSNFSTLVAAPLFTSDAAGMQQLLAVVLIEIGYENPFGSGINWRSFATPFLSVLIFAFFVGLIGSTFITRRVGRRIRQLEQTADTWATGDFSVIVRDRSPDEVGQLGRRLNQMAEQLQNLLAARMQLTAVEERNRLARELHDAAKQQVFAVDMQLYTAENLIDTDRSQAKTHLKEARRLTQQARTELDNLIAELRPAQLDGKGLFAALEETTVSFERQAQISTNVRLVGERELPLDIEQPFFRIFQEALSNVARHSSATELTVTLQATNNQLQLVVRDNGVGFDPTNYATGLGHESIKERVDKMGGQLKIESTVGEGTAVTITCPLI